MFIKNLEIVETVVQTDQPPVSSSSSEDEHEQEVDEIIVKDNVEPEVECEAPETVSTKNDEDFSPPSPSADENHKGEPTVSSSSSEDEHEQEVDEIIVKDNVEPEVGYEAPETVSTKNDEALPPPSPSADENDTGEESVVVEDITKLDEVSEETVITTTKHEESSSSSSSSSSSEDENDNEEKNITPTYVNVQDAIHVEPETSSTKSDDKTPSHEDENEIEAEEEIHENNTEADTELKEPDPVSEEIVDPPTTSYDKYTSLVTPSGFSAPVLTSQQQSDADYSSFAEPSDNPVADGVDASE